MANGGPEHIPDPTWWHAIGAMLMGGLAGRGWKWVRRGDDEGDPVRVSVLERLVSVIESENRATRETFVAQSEHTRRVLHDLDTRIQVLGALLEDARLERLANGRLRNGT